MEKIQVPIDLAWRLTDWHGSMYDPVYAVASNGIAEQSVPRDVFEKALAVMEENSEDPRLEEHKTGAVEICVAMRAVLGKVDDKNLFETISKSAARTAWADMWATEAEEHEDGYGCGAQLLHVAPETPASVQEKVDSLIKEILDKNKMSIGDLFSRFKDECANAHDFGHELAMSFVGYGGDINFDKYGIEIPYFETLYWEYVDRWIPE